MSTLPLPLNCPKCPRALTFIASDDDIRIYRCAVHGEWHLGPGGVYPPTHHPETGRMLERHVQSD